jgi:hypothetical protein
MLTMSGKKGDISKEKLPCVYSLYGCTDKISVAKMNTSMEEI